MRRFFLSTIILFLTLHVAAQIPYFAATVGDGKLYGYSSVKAHPGLNKQETYTTFQYGIGNHLATGIDLYTGPNCAYWGALVRYGTSFSQWFNVGTEVTPSFNLNDSFKFSYLTSALYLNGAITSNKRLFWCTNTWWIVNNDAPFDFSNYEYLGYTFPLRKGRSITPMVGALHSWKFDEDVDLAAGFYLNIKEWNFYLWGNELLRSHPRFIVGIDFTL